MNEIGYDPKEQLMYYAEARAYELEQKNKPLGEPCTNCQNGRSLWDFTTCTVCGGTGIQDE